jgi:hypothetical protein
MPWRLTYITGSAFIGTKLISPIVATYPLIFG